MLLLRSWLRPSAVAPCGAQVDFFITAVDFGNEPEPEKVCPHCNAAQRAAA
jgi:hypothetical protein